MRLPWRRSQPSEENSRASALRAIASVRSRTLAMAKWRPLRYTDAGQRDLDHAVRRFYGDGS